LVRRSPFLDHIFVRNGGRYFKRRRCRGQPFKRRNAAHGDAARSFRVQIQRVIFRIGLWSGCIGPGYALCYQPAGAHFQSGCDEVLCPFQANARVTDVPKTSYPRSRSSGPSLLPIAPVAPARKILRCINFYGSRKKIKCNSDSPGVCDPRDLGEFDRRAANNPCLDHTIFISHPSTFSSGLIFHDRFLAAP